MHLTGDAIDTLHGTMDVTGMRRTSEKRVGRQCARQGPIRGTETGQGSRVGCAGIQGAQKRRAISGFIISRPVATLEGYREREAVGWLQATNK